MGKQEGRAQYRVLSTTAIVLSAIGLIVVGTGVAVGLVLAYGSGSEGDRFRLEAIKTAGAIVVGTGGAAALWLAARRQRMTEIGQQHQEHVAAATEADAAERRVTELYTKAVEQLGSEKAPVRLGGMYALERLAQNTPGQRQTIVNVLCAYLRMPYTPPDQDPISAAAPPAATDQDAGLGNSPIGSAESADQREERERREQERQVRLTAQRILAARLSPGADHERPDEMFWPDIDLDLTGAVLVNFDLSGCHARTVQFDMAEFAGDASFDNVHFARRAGFGKASFSGYASFNRVEFSGGANFGGVRFSGYAAFDRAKFAGWAGFARAKFAEDTSFDKADFAGNVSFHATKFDGDTSFDNVKFAENVRFSLTSFSKYVSFDRARFLKVANFDRAEFSGGVSFGNAEFVGDVGLKKMRVWVDSSEGVAQRWPHGWSLQVMDASEDVRIPGEAGMWGVLIRNQEDVAAHGPAGREE
ncbi:hypothetical protein JOF53_002874 [Crossiella equi]|uniref:Pentapeptide repeat-containing protein n=1 Tax=Crossiella equi TaxID=130796 RepID=A0ABS5ACJ8_9PSEU|nr:pentapeptide repeat-containing protein [Crossiella equi]MBP2474002.1 hypothetical protein [Crossiella equi]